MSPFYLYFMCAGVLPRVYNVCVWCADRSEEDAIAYTGVTHGCEQPCESRGSNQGPLQEQTL